MNELDRLNELMGFSPKSMEQDEEEITPSDVESLLLKGKDSVVAKRRSPALEETVSIPEATVAYPESESQEPYAPKYGKLPEGHPSRWGTMGGEGSYTIGTYNPDTNLQGEISKRPIPEAEPMPTMEFTQPMTISGSGSTAAKESSIPTAQPSYGMHTPPVQTAKPKVNKLQARQNAQKWIKNNLDYLPDDASLGSILKEMPKEHRTAIKKTVDKAIKEGMSKQTIANWLLGRKKK